MEKLVGELGERVDDAWNAGNSMLHASTRDCEGRPRRSVKACRKACQRENLELRLGLRHAQDTILCGVMYLVQAESML